LVGRGCSYPKVICQCLRSAGRCHALFPWVLHTSV
jgi:hypothetical protein